MVSWGISQSTALDTDTSQSLQDTKGAVASTAQQEPLKATKSLQPHAGSDVKEERFWPLFDKLAYNTKWFGKDTAHGIKNQAGFESVAGHATYEAKRGVSHAVHGVKPTVRNAVFDAKMWFLKLWHKIEEGFKKMKHKTSELTRKGWNRIKEAKKAAGHRMSESKLSMKHDIKRKSEGAKYAIKTGSTSQLK
ncbi:uncharacterized protein PHALS_13298 [Plasmopara halstedii]|uniref:Uncharacterized protein n=1 Tax=Plasmopara halstedii TaxID=4781 RepID=A0A0P1APG1_PLAHL|nr:uncharacterized protein PHALS_13298 [Plasmopara halstedii]CEG43079.1 hypothetical protein PHALS_13298 [Plasmopara halstedii]|eukprot:XP_024579448.1 hypothetical protein PHALS_13298 [Plasmopara halstedii]